MAAWRRDGQRNDICPASVLAAKGLWSIGLSVFSWTTYGLDLDQRNDICHIFYSSPPFYYCSLPCKKDMARHSIFYVLVGRGKI